MLKSHLCATILALNKEVILNDLERLRDALLDLAEEFDCSCSTLHNIWDKTYAHDIPKDRFEKAFKLIDETKTSLRIRTTDIIMAVFPEIRAMHDRGDKEWHL